MEDRTKERLKSLQRENRTRRMQKARIITAIALLILIAVSIYRAKQLATAYLWNLDAFKIRQVHIVPEGLAPIVAGVIGVDATTSLFFLDINDIHHRITQLQIVERCRVRKIFPSTLDIEIIVRRPWIRLPGDPPLFIDRSGVVVPAPEDISPYWVVSGIASAGTSVRPEDQDKLRMVAELEKWYNQLNIGGIFPCTGIDISSPEKIILTSGLRQVYMVNEQIGEKFADLKTVLRECEQRAMQWEYIDLRFKNPYVKRAQ